MAEFTLSLQSSVNCYKIGSNNDPDLIFRVTTPTPDGGLFYQGGCRVHGTSIILPEDEAAKDHLFTSSIGGPTITSNGGHRGPETRRRSPRSQSVSPSPLASPVPPLGPAPPYDHTNCSDRMHKSCACVSFIAEHTKAREEATKVSLTATEAKLDRVKSIPGALSNLSSL